MRALEVIWIHDGVIRPPGPKMVACIEPVAGFFFRINTRPLHQTSVLLAVKSHSFLYHDSYLECGEPLELDDYVVDESIARRGIIGRIDVNLAGGILTAVDAARTISPADKMAIRQSLSSAR